MEHVCCVFGALHSERDLAWCGFMVPNSASVSGDELQGLLGQDDELADKMGSMTLALVSARLLRASWLLLGPQNRMLMALDGPNQCERVVQELKGDYEVFSKMKAVVAEGRAGAASEWLERSVLKLPHMIQLVRALRRRQWRVDAKMVQWLDKKSRRFVNSVLCEDGFNVSKNSKRVKGKKKYMRPQKAFSTVVLKRLVSKVHHYTPLSRNSAPAFRGAAVPMEAFRPPLRVGALELPSLCGTSAKPSWSSPGVDRLPVQFVDIKVGRDVFASDPPDFGLLDKAWVGELFHFKHGFVVRKKHDGGYSWFMPLSHCAGSGCLAWPGRLVRPGPACEYFAFDQSVKEPCILSAGSLEGWSCMAFRWRSPLWFASQAPGVGARGGSVVRHFLDGGERTLLQMAASRGFKGLST